MNDQSAQSTSYYSRERELMVGQQLRQRGIRDERVLNAMLRLPRHDFVSPEYSAQAYEDHPLPIGQEQTISQPFIIAISLQALALKGTESVLEVGTGSGYQTALLCLLARQVYSIERHPSLAEHASAILQQYGFCNAKTLVGDGSQGSPEYAPFDAIVVSAAAPSLPRSLFDQLTEGGRMVIPVGPPHAQELQFVVKRDGQPAITVLEGCRFVPLVGAEAY